MKDFYCCILSRYRTDTRVAVIHWCRRDADVFYYYYYAAFNAPCVGHKADESQARGHVDLRVAVSVIKRFKYLSESICSDVQVASDDVR